MVLLLLLLLLLVVLTIPDGKLFAASLLSLCNPFKWVRKHKSAKVQLVVG